MWVGLNWGRENYSTFLRFRGNEGVGIGIFQAAMLWRFTKAVKAEMARLAEEFS